MAGETLNHGDALSPLHDGMIMRVVTFDSGGNKAYVYGAGLPAAWDHYGLEVSEREAMIDAIGAFHAAMINGDPFTGEQFDLLVDYLIYYIYAPCWDTPTVETRILIDRLRKQSERLEDLADADQFIKDCLEVGLDPL